MRNRLWGVVAWIAGIVFVFPVIWMILTALKQSKDVTTNPPVWFFTPTFEHFSTVLGGNITPFLLNSLMASVFSTLLVIVLATPAAYALSLRPVRKWTDALFFFISTKMMPPVAAVLPVYLLTVKIGMKDNTVASTAPIYLLGFISGRGPFLADLSAAATLLSLPVLIAGWVAQNKLVRGLSMGAVK